MQSVACQMAAKKFHANVLLPKQSFLIDFISGLFSHKNAWMASCSQSECSLCVIFTDTTNLVQEVLGTSGNMLSISFGYPGKSLHTFFSHHLLWIVIFQTHGSLNFVQVFIPGKAPGILLPIFSSSFIVQQFN